MPLVLRTANENARLYICGDIAIFDWLVCAMSSAIYRRRQTVCCVHLCNRGYKPHKKLRKLFIITKHLLHCFDFTSEDCLLKPSSLPPSFSNERFTVPMSCPRILIVPKTSWSLRLRLHFKNYLFTLLYFLFCSTPFY